MDINNGFPLFFHALLNFALEQCCTYWAVLGNLGKFAVVYAPTLFCNILSFWSQATVNVPLLVFSGTFKISCLHLNFLPKLGKNYEIITLRGRPAATTLMADSIWVAPPIRLLHLHTSRILLRIIRININSININQSCPVKIAMNHATWDVYC